MTFLEELRRRNVVRVAVLYIVASWLVLQVTDVLSSLLPVPEWTGSLIFILLVAGFLPALIFSWIYELTPEGLKREKEVDRGESVTHVTGRKINILTIVLLVLAIGVVAVDRMIPEKGANTVDPATHDAELASDSFPPEPSAVADEMPANGPERSIAVLPFVNMSSDEENEYFSDGLAEELLNLLSRVPELRVAARTSSFSFKGKDADIPEIAESLNVSNILEGSVRKSGNRVRITVQLIDAREGFHLWSENYDHDLDDIFEVQDEVAASVVEALKLNLLDTPPPLRRTDPKAYALYLRGLHELNRGSMEGLQEAEQLFGKALDIDPEYAPAWEALSVTWLNQVSFLMLPGDAGRAKAEEATRKALAINPDSARAWGNLGWIAMHFDWDPAAAARYLSKARSLAPDDASVLNVIATLLGYLGRHEDAIAMGQRIVEMDPLNPTSHHNLAIAYVWAKRGEDAEVAARQEMTVAQDAAYARYWLGRSQLLQDDMNSAVSSFESAREVLFRLEGLAMANHGLGRQEDSDALLERMEIEFYESGTMSAPAAVSIARVHAYRGNVDQAFQWLQRGYELRDYQLMQSRGESVFEALHADPRWEELLERLGLSDEQVAEIEL
jgi:TolB-like protein/Flp pilus assembly protein TadD